MLVWGLVRRTHHRKKRPEAWPFVVEWAAVSVTATALNGLVSGAKSSNAKDGGGSVHSRRGLFSHVLDGIGRLHEIDEKIHVNKSQMVVVPSLGYS